MLMLLGERGGGGGGRGGRDREEEGCWNGFGGKERRMEGGRGKHTWKEGKVVVSPSDKFEFFTMYHFRSNQRRCFDFSI